METALEQILSRFYKTEMIAQMHSHPEYFDEAITLAVSDKQPYSWRSAWLLCSCLKKEDIRLQDHIDKILASLPDKKDGHQRELLKLLKLMNLSDEQEGLLFNMCLSIWESVNKKPSLRYNAFIFVLEIAEKYPCLSNEINFLTQSQYLETLSPGIKRTLNKLINKNL